MPVFLPGKFHGQRILEGYSPRGHKELDTIEQLYAAIKFEDIIVIVNIVSSF